MGRSPLCDTLAVLLPTPHETALLRACLHTGEPGREAWGAWCERVGDAKAAFKEDRAGIKRLLPLLSTALQANGAVVDSAVLSYLRAAYVTEELRGATYRRVCASVLSTLTAHGIPVLALKGVALTEQLYGSWALRHSHDIDLLLRDEDCEHVARLLLPLGFVTVPAHRRSGALRLIHSSGLPLELHTRLFRLPFYRPPLEEMWGRSHTRVIAGIPTRILSPADNLFHVCGQASCCRGRESLQWACDAWYLLLRHPNLDWDVLLDASSRSRFALPLSVLLAYLARELQAPIPAFVIERLDACASRADAIERQVALLGARSAPRGTFRSLLRHSADWLTRAEIVKWMLLPSPQYLRSTGQLLTWWSLPGSYLMRPLRYLARRSKHRVRRGMS